MLCRDLSWLDVCQTAVIYHGTTCIRVNKFKVHYYAEQCTYTPSRTLQQCSIINEISQENPFSDIAS